MGGWLARPYAFLALALIFLRELWRSSVAVARAALAPEVSVRPATVAVPVDLRTDLGVTTVANLVTLTPGTTSLHVSDDRSLIYVHSLDASAAEEVAESIRSTFEQWVRRAEG